MTEVPFLTEAVSDARRLSPEDLLRMVLTDLPKQSFKPNKCLVLCLDDAGGYSLMFYNAGLSQVEIVTLLEAARTLMVHDMLNLEGSFENN